MMTGLVFGLIAVLWVAYLVPWGSRRDRGWVRLDEDSVLHFNNSIRLVRDCAANQKSEETYSVSTPLTRRAVRYEVWRAKRIAARRRRAGLLFSLIFLILAVVLPFVSALSHWFTLVGVGVFIGWIGLMRYSVKALDNVCKRALARAELVVEEPTIVFVAATEPEIEANERMIELSLTDTIGSLLEPIPVTPTTYMSKPLLPRSVRTIDLSAPMVPQRPVTAEPPAKDQPALIEVVKDLPHAVGE